MIGFQDIALMVGPALLS